LALLPAAATVAVEVVVAEGIAVFVAIEEDGVEVDIMLEVKVSVVVVDP